MTSVIIKRSMFRFVGSTALFMAFMAAGCSTADHMNSVNTAQGRNTPLTVGTVQREIRVGMASADVVGTLGSPNMVTTDDERRENWVYDRVSTDTAYSSSSAGVGLLILGRAVQRCRLAVTESTLQHLMDEMRRLIARGIPNLAIV